MIVILKRHRINSCPGIQWVREEIPLGREYEVIGFERALVWFDTITHKHNSIDCYLVTGYGSTGFMPVALFSDEDKSLSEKNFTEKSND